MSSFFDNIISNAFNHLLGDKTKPQISVLLYLFSGMLLGLCIVSNITPFHCGIEWLNNIAWEENLCDSSAIVQLTSLTILLYIFVCFLRKILVRTFPTLNKQTLSVLYVVLYTVDDFFLLVSSIFSLIFSFSVFYKCITLGYSLSRLNPYGYIFGSGYSLLCLLYVDLHITIQKLSLGYWKTILIYKIPVYNDS